MTTNRCDNCRRIIKDGDLEKLNMYFSFSNDLVLCKKCRVELVSLVLASDFFSDKFKRQILTDDPLVKSLEKLKKLKINQTSPAI